jgi:hypothetical protein
MVKLGFWPIIPLRHLVDLRRLRRLRRGQHHIQGRHRRLEFGTQLTPPTHRLNIVHARHHRAEQQPLLHACAEIT